MRRGEREKRNEKQKNSARTIAFEQGLIISSTSPRTEHLMDVKGGFLTLDYCMAQF